MESIGRGQVGEFHRYESLGHLEASSCLLSCLDRALFEDFLSAGPGGALVDRSERQLPCASLVTDFFRLVLRARGSVGYGLFFLTQPRLSCQDGSLSLAHARLVPPLPSGKKPGAADPKNILKSGAHLIGSLLLLSSASR